MLQEHMAHKQMHWQRERQDYIALDRGEAHQTQVELMIAGQTNTKVGMQGKQEVKLQGDTLELIFKAKHDITQTENPGT